ncbi:3028_t:CDS:1 [Funneliformis geosporum]|nr:3028_t:CDS:1 [Funneliformis geosporum]
MLTTSNAKFYIWMLPSHWYHTKENRNKEPFLIADKFFHNLTTELSNIPIPCLYLFRQNDYDFREDNLTTLEQKITYGNIHGMYKKALHKALQNKIKSQQLIGLLQEFAEDDDDEQLKLNNMEQDDLNDKENVDPTLPLL